MSRRYRRNRPQPKEAPFVPQLQVLESEIKSNPAYTSLVTFAGLPQPHMMDKNFKTYAIEGYRGNDTLYKCINYIVTNGAAIPPKLYTDDSMQKEIETHPVLDKLKRPNPEQNGVNYRKAVIGSFLVAGNSFQYAIRKNKAGPPDELWVLEPHKVKILPTKTRGIVGFNYDEFENTSPPLNPIDAANIAHMKTWSPDNPLWGVSPIEVGAIQVDQQLAAKKWNLALLQNSAKMSGAFTTEIIMSPNDRSKVEDRVNEKITGFRNAGRVPVLDGGLKWNQMSVNPQQMDWLQSLQYNAGALANLYNMPPQLIGDTSASTYENMEQAKAASYTEEIFPVLDELYALWTMWLLPMYPDLQGAFLYYDKESVEVVQTVIQAKKTAIALRAKEAWMSGEITMNEAREMQDLPPDPAGDVYRIGNVLVRKEDLSEYAEQSLQTPAGPPSLVPEPLTEVTPSTQVGGAGGNNKSSSPKPAGANANDNDGNVPNRNEPNPSNQSSGGPAKSLPLAPPYHAILNGKANTKAEERENKELDSNGIYQPDDLMRQLDAYRHQGATYLTWHVDGGTPCETCMENDGVEVEVGMPFPNGSYLPPAHPNCKCSVDTFAEYILKQKDDEMEEKRRHRAEFRRYMKEVMA